MITPKFLTVNQVLMIHKNQIELYGGLHGLRDEGLLLSALAIPRASFSGEYLCMTIFQMAAAYLFHICQNHPFIDGNKRIGAASCLVFLDVNNAVIRCNEGNLYDMVIAVTLGKLRKEGIAEILENGTSGTM